MPDSKKPKVCKALDFRAAHSGLRLSLVGYSVASPAIEAEYEALVKCDVRRVGPYDEETHTCVYCGKKVFEASHS